MPFVDHKIAYVGCNQDAVPESLDAGLNVTEWPNNAIDNASRGMEPAHEDDFIQSKCSKSGYRMNTPVDTTWNIIWQPFIVVKTVEVHDKPHHICLD